MHNISTGTYSFDDKIVSRMEPGKMLALIMEHFHRDFLLWTSESCILTEKWRNRTENPVLLSFIRLEFVKKTSIPKSVLSLGYSLCKPWPLESSSNFVKCNCQKICSRTGRPKTTLETKNHISKATFSKILLTAERKLNMVVVLSYRHVHIILKHSEYRWTFPAIWKTKFLQMLIEKIN